MPSGILRAVGVHRRSAGDSELQHNEEHGSLGPAQACLPLCSSPFARSGTNIGTRHGCDRR
jgi:hypothetical protein